MFFFSVFLCISKKSLFNLDILFLEVLFVRVGFLEFLGNSIFIYFLFYNLKEVIGFF